MWPSLRFCDEKWSGVQVGLTNRTKWIIVRKRDALLAWCIGFDTFVKEHSNQPSRPTQREWLMTEIWDIGRFRDIFLKWSLYYYTNFIIRSPEIGKSWQKSHSALNKYVLLDREGTWWKRHLRDFQQEYLLSSIFIIAKILQYNIYFRRNCLFVIPPLVPSMFVMRSSRSK